VANVPAAPLQCSQTTTSADSVTIQNLSECNFQINVKNYHNGNNADTVSPLTSYTLTIKNPGVTWSQSEISLPSQSIPGTWQYSISNAGQTLNFHEVAKYLIDPAYAQPGGTIWTPHAPIDNPDTGQPIIVEWSDSDILVPATGVSTLESSGIDTISCANGLTDSVRVLAGANCDYTLIVGNTHTHPTSSIDAFAMSIPVSAGSFPSSCFSSSNGWARSVPGQSARFTNDSGASHYLRTGSFDTIHFCINPALSGASWVLTWITYDSMGNQLNTNTLTVPGCSPPLVCDSIRHIMGSNSCSDSIVVLNLRQGGAEVDSIIVAPEAGWNIVKVDTPLFWQAAIEPDGSVRFTTSSHAITPGLSQPFAVWYNNPDPNSFTVEVGTYSNSGTACSNTQTLACPMNGVSSSGVPQSLDVSVVPNPMSQQADISLTIGTFDRVQMTLMDVLGRTAKTVVNGTIAAGDHDYMLDVSQLPPGTYYLRVETSGATLTKKLVVEH
jgi:hypothetical protein